MGLIPYGRQHIDKKDIKAVAAVLKSDYLTQGPQIAAFEQELARRAGSRYAVVFCNATAALCCAVAALDIEKGADAITSPNTFLASANCLLYNGLQPKFADIDPTSYNISPKEISKRLTKRTKLLIPVHFAGLACDMQAISALAQKHKLFIIEDAAHAIGSRYADGAPVGSCRYADMTVFSFHPVKTLTSGEGGAVTVNNPALYERLLRLRSHGITRDPLLMEDASGPWRYEMLELSYNFRLTDIQAALGLSQLKKLDAIIHKRQKLAQFYNRALAGNPFIQLPQESAPQQTVRHLYPLLIDFPKLKKSRSSIMQTLQAVGIGSQAHYIPVHIQPYYRKNFGFRYGDFPQAEAYYEKTLSIPFFAGLKAKQAAYIAKQIHAIIQP